MNIQSGYQHFLIVAPLPPPLFRRPKNTTPQARRKTAGNIPAQTIHNPPKLYIMYVMRLLRKQSDSAAESPAVKLDKKIIQNKPIRAMPPRKPRFSTNIFIILPITSSFYRYKNTPDKADFLLFLPILPILPINCLT